MGLSPHLSYWASWFLGPNQGIVTDCVTLMGPTECQDVHSLSSADLCSSCHIQKVSRSPELELLPAYELVDWQEHSLFTKLTKILCENINIFKKLLL